MEGIFGDSHASDAFTRFTNVQFKYNDYTPLILGEWGSVNKIQTDPGPPPVYRNITVTEATTTFQALNKYFPTMYFFEHPALDPGNGADYGAVNYTLDATDGLYKIDSSNRYNWYEILKNDVYPMVED